MTKRRRFTADFKATSPEFGKLAEKTRKDYRRYLDALRDEFGSLPIDALSDRRIRQDFFDWREQFASTPRTANYAWSILRKVLSWAYDRGKIDINHAIKPGRLYDSDHTDEVCVVDPWSGAIGDGQVGERWE